MQFDDALAIAAVEQLARTHLDRWGGELGLEDLVQRILDMAEGDARSRESAGTVGC